MTKGAVGAIVSNGVGVKNGVGVEISFTKQAFATLGAGSPNTAFPQSTPLVSVRIVNLFVVPYATLLISEKLHR